jgi:hypothetical protein
VTITELHQPPTRTVAEPVAGRVGRLERLRRRRRAAGHDRRVARLAELHVLRGLVADAAGAVEAGWVRGGWFAYTDEGGTPRLTTTLSARRAAGRPIVGVCLVGAVVQAGGGLPAVRSQPVQRALDLVWHALARGDDGPVRWCPEPAVRASHIRDLTGWNDRPSRSAADVVALLRDAESLAGREIARLERAG